MSIWEPRHDGKENQDMKICDRDMMEREDMWLDKNYNIEIIH